MPLCLALSRKVTKLITGVLSIGSDTLKQNFEHTIEDNEELSSFAIGFIIARRHPSEYDITIQAERLETRVFFSVEQMLTEERGHPIGFYVVCVATDAALDFVSNI